MNLLLLLSALLSALSGVGASVRAPGVAQSVAASSVAARVAPSALRATTERPVAGLPDLIAVARAAVRTAVPTVADARLWASRRRE